MLGLILWVVLGLLVLVIVLALVVFCTPWRLLAEFDTSARPAFVVRLLIVGGLIPLFSVSGIPRQAAPEVVEPDTTKQSKKTTGPMSRDTIVRMMRATPRLFSRVITKFKLEDAKVDLLFGLGDPADTGAVFGALQPVAPLVESATGVHLTLRPDFHNARFACCGEAAVRITPITLIPPALGFGWTVFLAPHLPARLR